LMADAVLDGMTQGAVASGVDIGAAANPVETAITEEVAAEVAPEPAPAPAPAKEEAAPAVEAKADDISLIDGVGPAYQKKFEAAGITTFKQIAELDAAAVEKLNEEHDFKGKIVSGEWVEQAKELMAGKPPRAKVDQAKAAAAAKA